MATRSNAGMRPARRPPHGTRLEIGDLFARCTGDPLAAAFAGKGAVHPFLSATPMPEERWQGIWREIAGKARQGKSVAYLHIPFCENHCLFCGFYQNRWRADRCADYAAALVSELRQGVDVPVQRDGPIHAVYLGGGTPSALAAGDLLRILTAVRETLPLAPDCEITVEGRAHGFDLDKVRACFDGGANRISIGVQTFDTRMRRRLGRKADGRRVAAFLEQLAREDRGAIVIDLMYGFPGQSLESWARDVEIATGTGIDGVDLYMLNLLPRSPLATAVANGRFPAPTPPGAFGEFYRGGAEILDRAGWTTLSTTHWRRTTRERNLYNLLVKAGASCLAFGSGAGGFLDGHSFRLAGDLDAYLDAVAKGERRFSFMVRTSAGAAFLNTVKAQLEVGRLDVDWLTGALAERGLDGDEILAPVIDQWQRAGLLASRHGRAELTLAGRFWQVTMTQKLLLWLEQQLQPAAMA